MLNQWRQAFTLAALIFCHYSHLQGNAISGIEDQELCELQLLNYINLDNNLLDEDNLQEDVFTCVPELTTLYEKHTN